ncbi:alpha-ketoacid dehydrogenase subunit beta [Nocardioides agariphilus]|uniref:Alpha-ketoacid dehydrogenase subunit beta n=1 Tax=Nocardioides agariphilus TaxID=433664 RepID=A0A930YI50_9ACTN|nr:transketolase C-terminal domain-containing protein [Nocardioides agariphilus]MBF4769361.1 alpha-ketoacid dehydrogenase subunit beta [Nocardioides agariphilus]
MSTIADDPQTSVSVRGRQLTFTEAMVEALDHAMTEDDGVVLMGEDIGRMGGVAGQTRGLHDKYGDHRVIDTPISEAAFFGLAAGAAQRGMRPVVELMRVDFAGVAMDQIYNYIAKIGYCTNGRRRVPMTIMTQVGNPLRQGAVHAQTLYGMFAHIPGLKVVAPSNSHDAKGLLYAAVRCEDPVVFLFHSSLLAIPAGPGIEEWTALDVPTEAYAVEIGKARTVREGRDVTVVSSSYTVHECLRVAQRLEALDISCEVVDLRSIVPLDIDHVVSSVARTGRLLVVDEDYAFAGLSGEIVAQVTEAGVAMSTPPRRVAREHLPIPYSRILDDQVRPSGARIEEAVRDLVSNG